MTIGAGGRIFLTGEARLGESKVAAGVAVLEPSGKPDPSFSTDGVTLLETTGIEKSDRGEAIVEQPDGRIVVADSTGNGAGNGFTLVRLLANGELDQIVRRRRDRQDADPSSTNPGRSRSGHRSRPAARRPHRRRRLWLRRSRPDAQTRLPVRRRPLSPQRRTRQQASAAPDRDLRPSGRRRRGLGAGDRADPGRAAAARGQLRRAAPSTSSPAAHAARRQRPPRPGVRERRRGAARPHRALRRELRGRRARLRGTAGRGQHRVRRRRQDQRRRHPLPRRQAARGRGPGRAAANRPPHARIKKVPKKISAAKLKRFSGTASDPDGDALGKVQIALVKLLPQRGQGVAAGKGRAARACLVMKNAKARFKRVKPKRGQTLPAALARRSRARRSGASS